MLIDSVDVEFIHALNAAIGHRCLDPAANSRFMCIIHHSDPTMDSVCTHFEGTAYRVYQIVFARAKAETFAIIGFPRSTRDKKRKSQTPSGTSCTNSSS